MKYTIFCTKCLFLFYFIGCYKSAKVVRKVG